MAKPGDIITFKDEAGQNRYYLVIESVAMGHYDCLELPTMKNEWSMSKGYAHLDVVTNMFREPKRRKNAKN